LQEPEITLINMLRRYPNLRRVDLSETRVTGVAVKELVDRESGPLEWLGLNHCTRVSSDAFDYARAKGVTVEVTMIHKQAFRAFRSLGWE